MRTGGPATTTHAITQCAHPALSLENPEVAAAGDYKCPQRVGPIRAQPIPCAHNGRHGSAISQAGCPGGAAGTAYAGAQPFVCAQTTALGQCTALVICSTACTHSACCASLQCVLTNLTSTLHAQASLSQVLQSVQTGNTALLAGPSAAAVAAVGDSVARAFREALAKNLMPDLQRWVLPDICHAPLQALPFALLATKCHQGPCLVYALLERALRWACQTRVTPTPFGLRMRVCAGRYQLPPRCPLQARRL